MSQVGDPFVIPAEPYDHRATLVIQAWTSECGACGHGRGGWASSPALEGKPILTPSSTVCPGCGVHFTEALDVYTGETFDSYLLALGAAFLAANIAVTKRNAARRARLLADRARQDAGDELERLYRLPTVVPPHERSVG